MNIKPETKKISAIFGLQSDEAYIVPIYQRNYSWKEKQIDTLYNDLLEEQEGYYLGNLLLVDNNDRKFHVIDGQQRITTISLFLLAIFDNLSIITPNLSEEQKKISYRIISDIERMLFTSKNDYRLSLLDNDEIVYKALLKAIIKKEKIDRFGNLKFSKRYRFIKESLKEKLLQFEDISDFYNKVINLELLTVKVNNLNDAYKAFSSLNSKGVPLTQLDLLKVTYLQYSSNNNINPISKWDILVSNFKIDENEESDPKYITQFLSNNFDTFESKDKTSITKSQIISKYEIKFKNNKNYIDELIKNSEIFVRMIQNKSSDNIVDKKLNILKSLDASQAYPLILYILEKKLDDIYLERILDLIIKFFIRRNICSKPKSSDIRSKILGLIRDFDQNLSKEEIFERTKEVFKKISVDDESFYLSLTKEPIYESNYDTTRYILIDLERKFGHKFSKEYPDNLDRKEKEKFIWTIEHIIPQGRNLPDSWKNEILPTLGGLTIEDVLDNNVHQIGNLTLTGFNSELGNKSFSEKKAKYINDLFLNESIISKEKWTLLEIEARNNYFGRLIVDMYTL